MNSLTSSYRTYVLNDFSAVSKAVFYILLKSENIKGSYTIFEKLPVQINPTKISCTVGESRNKFVKDMQREAEASLKSHQEGDEDNMYEISLVYDIYDEYNVRTLNGISNASFIKGGMSLFDEKTTSLEKLKMASGDSEKFVLFIWGDIQIFGHIEKVTADYTAFSRWGNPLKADATIHIKKVHLGFDKFKKGTARLRKERQPLDTLEIPKTIIESYQKAENALVTAAAAIDALR